MNSIETANKCLTKMFCAVSFFSALAVAELPPEKVPSVAKLSLQKDYTDSLIYAQDANFDALIAGRVVLLDVGADVYHYKGALDASQFASFITSPEIAELYVAETFYSRGTRGERTDVITVYDKETLAVIDEIPLPGGKRGLVVTQRYSLQLIDNNNYLLVFNFTPAASVSFIDVAQRKVLSETTIPGCSLMYPLGERGFAALCGDGAMLSMQFDSNGKVTGKHMTAAFVDIDADPLFDKPVYIGQTAYFPSFKGRVQPVDMSGSKPALGKAWSLVSKEERSQNWRPGGWQIATAGDTGLLYVLMHQDGADGTHKNGGSEVWVFDPKQQARVKRIALESWGVSIAVTAGKKPYLVVTNADMQLDVYSAASGAWVRMIGGAAAMPLVLYSNR